MRRTSIKQALLEYLENHPAIITTAGGRVSNRLAPPGTARPHIVYTVPEITHTHHMGGASGLGTLTLQLDVYADTAPDAEDATEAIREALDGYNAPMGAIDRVTATHETTTEDIDDPSAARETAIHRETSFFTITYGETVPAHATRRS